jgi:hypothetical protein
MGTDINFKENSMKKTVSMILPLLLAAGFLFAQEIPAGMTPEQLEAAKAAAAAGMTPEQIQAAITAAGGETGTETAAPASGPAPSVKTPLGELNIDGRVIAGFEAN